LAERKRRTGILNKRQLAFVMAHVGNDTEAARAAGYKNPERSAPKLMAMPSIRRAIAKKQKAIIAASGVRIGQRLTRVDVLKRLIELANLPPDCTRYNISGQVSALKVIADIEGFVVNRYEDLTKEFADRTAAEKEYFATHGYWPNEMEPSQPGVPGSEGVGTEGAQQEQNGTESSPGEGGD